MPALSFAPALSLLAAFHRVSPVRPIETFLRHAEEKFRPGAATEHVCAERPAQDAVFARGETGPQHLATILRRKGHGRTPTIVLGGFVPDATEQVFLLRRLLRRSGDIYYVHYPRQGFSLDLICAQLDDLTSELAARGESPVIFSVSFGAGLLLEWLRRARLAHREAPIAGAVLVSPVTCVEDIIARGGAKPATLLGRALQPLLSTTEVPSAAAVEKSRTIFTRMFEAGAQNRDALRLLMSASELLQLRQRVIGTIRSISAEGACSRIQALNAMPAPTSYFSARLLPLTSAPVLVLYAEKEDAVLDPASPARFVFRDAIGAYFSRGKQRVISAMHGAPVQHASLIFHVFEFLPPIAQFYRQLKPRKFRAAA